MWSKPDGQSRRAGKGETTREGLGRIQGRCRHPGDSSGSSGAREVRGGEGGREGPGGRSRREGGGGCGRRAAKAEADAGSAGVRSTGSLTGFLALIASVCNDCMGEAEADARSAGNLLRISNAPAANEGTGCDPRWAAL